MPPPLLALVTFATLRDMGKGHGFASPFATLVAIALLLAQLPLPALAAGPYAATYFATVPATMTQEQTVAVPVTLTNTGTATWNATGTNPVNLAYHWYDASGNLLTWDGARTALGGDVAPGALRIISAQVAAPPRMGTYQLRFALVKEGVAWFDPEPVPHDVNVVGPYAATLANAQLPRFVAGASASVTVTVTNSGSATWTGTGANPVDVSYHWYDGTGQLIAWDGARTTIGSDLAPGASRTIVAAAQAPITAGSYVLALDVVREGVAWFGAPLRLATMVEPARYVATYSVGATSLAFIGETKTFPATVSNAGNVTWPSGGASPVNLSYHWYDASGRVVVWDGRRTPLGSDVAPGAARSVDMQVAMPVRSGTYSLRIDLVREGVGWFSDLGTAPASLTVQVQSGYNAGYGADTTPSSISTGATIPITIELFNTGSRPWPAAGTNPVTLSYHIYDASGGVVVWDGARGALPADVPPGGYATGTVNAVAPGYSGNFNLVLDLVQEGVTWFSVQGIPGKQKGFNVFPGVTLYGKGWGHGVGMAQWGAQGWATGAGGVTPLTGEQIVQKYYPGAVISPVDPKPFRVLLSAPSTGCNFRTIYDVAQMRSDGGMRVLKAEHPEVVLMTAAPGQTVRVRVSGALSVMDEWSARVVYSGGEALVLVPQDPAKPITVDQKNRFYRGTLGFYVGGPTGLRVVNWVMPDDYARGSVPAEMPSSWHVEAYKAQAYAARTYAAWKASTSTSLPYDLRDDTSDQCYGGASVETTPTNTAAQATAGKILTYGGAPIRAYYASSSGGAVDGDGCVWNLARSATGGLACGVSQPYLKVVQDPADLAAYDPRGANPHRIWARTFTAEDVRFAVLAQAGVDIGAFVSIDLENRAGGGHVIAVRVRGTAASVEVRGDEFLRTRLGLKSTLVRIAPF